MHGIKTISLLVGMDSDFDVINGVVIDYMHGILLGIVKTMTLLWFDQSSHTNRPVREYPSYFIGNSVIKFLSQVQMLRIEPRKCFVNNAFCSNICEKLDGLLSLVLLISKMAALILHK